MAHSRAKVRLVKLTHLETVNRANVLSLFQPPTAAAAVEASSQETEDTVEADEDAEDAAQDDGPVQAEISSALRLLGLAEMPGSMTELNKVLRAASRTAHPDKSGKNGSQQEAAHAHMVALLEARRVLRAAMVASFGPETVGA